MVKDITEIAKEIRKELKVAFPGTKFSVRSKSFSGGSSINISWVDFPTLKVVEELTNKYRDVRTCPTTGEILNGGNRYINHSNDKSEEMKSAIESDIINRYGVEFYEEIKDSYNVYTYINEAYNRLYNESLVVEVAPAQEVEAKGIEGNLEETLEDVKVSFNEQKEGIEIKFNSKPSQEVLEKLKSNGFRWSKYQKIWYAKQTEERKVFALSLTSNIAEVESEPIEYEKIDIDDIESYVVSDDLSKAENNSAWIFRTEERDHTEELQNELTRFNNQFKKIIEGATDESLIYHSKKWLQSWKKKYYNNYISLLTNKANNPSWAVTGRDGRNRSKDKRSIAKYDKLLAEHTELVNLFDSKLRSISNKINSQAKAKFNEELEQLDTSSIKLKRANLVINCRSINNIFNGEHLIETTGYTFNDYYIIKNWGRWRIYNIEGNELAKTSSTANTLNDVKKLLVYLNKQAV